MYEIVYEKNNEVIKIEVETCFDYFNLMDRLIKSYIDKIKIISVKYK